jgi:dTDP-glucose 4,6-dehydratase
VSCWLVTGGAGFIGSNFVRLLAASEQSASIVVLDALTYAGNLENIADFLHPGKIDFVRGDITDADALSGVFRKYPVTKVVHFAAESHVDRSILGPRAFVRTNVEGTCNLLEAAREAWEGDYANRLFLHVSTDEVYGDLEAEGSAFNEETPFNPSSPYSASKAASDHLVLAWYRTFGLPAIISNCSNNFGPYQFPEKLIPLFVLNALDGRPLPVYGDGLQVRDWLHVTDHCEAIAKIIESGTPGQTYCVGGNNERTNLDIVQRVCVSVDELTGRPAGTSLKLVKHVKDRPGHDRRYAIDSSKLKKELGWSPRFDFDEALPDVVRWYMENRAWSDRVRTGEYRKYYTEQYASV